MPTLLHVCIYDERLVAVRPRGASGGVRGGHLAQSTQGTGEAERWRRLLVVCVSAN